MTSKRPYRFAKQWTGGRVDVQVFELFSCVNSFFCSDKFTYLLNSWMKTSYRSVVVPRLIPHIEMRQQNLSHNSTCRVPALSYTVKALISNEVSPSPCLKWKVALFLAQFNQKLELSSTCCANSRKTLVLKLDFIYSFSKIHQIFQTFLFKVTDGEKLISHWLFTIILNQSQIMWVSSDNL